MKHLNETPTLHQLIHKLTFIESFGFQVDLIEVDYIEKTLKQLTKSKITESFLNDLSTKYNQDLVWIMASFVLGYIHSMDLSLRQTRKIYTLGPNNTAVFNNLSLTTKGERVLKSLNMGA